MKSIVLICALLIGSTLAWPRIRHEQHYLESAIHSLNDPAPAQWVDQILDHFDPTNKATFPQQYYVNNTFWLDPLTNKTGPVLLSISGEGPLNATSVSEQSGSTFYAREIGAMIVSLEHRFYGKSLPFGTNVSTEALHYLHSRQALADLAYFIDHLRLTGTIREDTPVISIGGSYAGAMSAWLKSQYPDKLAGAHSSSGPVHAEQNFSAYMDVVAAGLGSQCTSLVQNASSMIDTFLVTPAGRTNLTVLFNTCSSIDTNKDVGLFIQNLVGPLTALVQYNTNYRAVNITSACDYLFNAANYGANAMEALASFNSYYNNLKPGLPFSQSGCMEVNYTKYVTEDMQQPGAGRSWTYQCCNEFGWWQTSEDNVQPFSQTWNTMDWQQDQCYDIFGKNFNTSDLVDGTNRFYGGRTLHADNLFMANGATDPWHHESIYSVESGTIVGDNVQYKLIGPTSHCQDIGAPHSSDIPELIAVRSEIVAAMRTWVENHDSSSDDTIWIITVCVIGGLAVCMLFLCVGWRMKQTSANSHHKANEIDNDSMYSHLNA